MVKTCEAGWELGTFLTSKTLAVLSSQRIQFLLLRVSFLHSSAPDERVRKAFSLMFVKEFR